MLGRMTTLAAITMALLLGLTGNAVAQADGWPVTLVLRDGTPVPFTIMPSTHRDSRGLPLLQYYDGSTQQTGHFMANVGGTSTRIPVAQIARLDLVSPGEQTVWRATLRDGRVFDGAVAGSSPNVWLSGVNQFGAEESLWSDPRNPERQPFIAVVLDADAVAAGSGPQPAARADADTVSLRNGDVLSGSILSEAFTVAASYGTLTFTQEQLASITIEDAAGRTDQFVLKVGDRVSGVLQNATIEMTLTSGATITLEKGSIASITFATQD